MYGFNFFRKHTKDESRKTSKNSFLFTISHAKPFLLHTKMTLTQVQPLYQLQRMYHCIINSFDICT